MLACHPTLNSPPSTNLLHYDLIAQISAFANCKYLLQTVTFVIWIISNIIQGIGTPGEKFSGPGIVKIHIQSFEAISTFKVNNN